jgi:hypothetical protein
MSVLRPGDLRHYSNQEPEQRMAREETKAPTLTPEWVAAYDRLSAAQARQLCETDSNFNALADELYAKRNPGGVR